MKKFFVWILLSGFLTAGLSQFAVAGIIDILNGTLPTTSNTPSPKESPYVTADKPCCACRAMKNGEQLARSIQVPPSDNKCSSLNGDSGTLTIAGNYRPSMPSETMKVTLEDCQKTVAVNLDRSISNNVNVPLQEPFGCPDIWQPEVPPPPQTTSTNTPTPTNSPYAIH